MQLSASTTSKKKKLGNIVFVLSYPGNLVLGGQLYFIRSRVMAISFCDIITFYLNQHLQTFVEIMGKQLAVIYNENCVLGVLRSRKLVTE